ncbi:MAG: hypothetical protein FJ109_05075 [Deltaproteobacteria bacterium]|nr:hypothetical protein [Deltaproteobacteria bacterium]
MRVAVSLALAASILAAGAGRAVACGSSCDCPQGKQCDAAGACKAAGTISGPGVHPVCCTGDTCAPVGSPCEHPDGSIGECPEPGCAPASCSSLDTGCGLAEDGCGGTVYCGGCAPGSECLSGTCVENCIPDCSDKDCGDDGCGGSCGTCPPNWSCKENFKCGFCKGDCTGKACGDDGCGGNCGDCPPGEICTNLNFCIACESNCTGRECGDDGCGGSCGTCGFSEECSAQGNCMCAPNCLNKECGDNGCGGSCGACPAGWQCTAQTYCTAMTSPEPPPEDVSAGPDVADTGSGQQENALQELRAHADAPASGDAGVDGTPPVDCPPGQHAVYGVCAVDTPEKKPSQSGGGCSSGRSPPSPPSALALLLATLAVCALLGRHRGATSIGHYRACAQPQPIPAVGLADVQPVYLGR